MPQLCMAIAHASPVPLNERRADAPEGLVRIVSRCLAKDPQQRVASVAELARALVAFAPTESRLSADRIDRMSRSGNLATTELAVGEPPAENRASASQFLATETVDGFGRTKPGPPSKRKHLAIAALALLTVASAMIATVTRCQDSDPATAAEAPSAVASSAPSPAVAAPAHAPSIAQSIEAPTALPVPVPETASSDRAPRSAPSTRPSRPQRAPTTPAKTASAPGTRSPPSSTNPVASSSPPGHGSLGGRL
jgi:serine/threonine-protein kinase